MSQTGQTPTIVAFLSAAASLALCVREGEEGGLLGKHKAHNQGISTQSTPCLSPSIMHKNVKRIFFLRARQSHKFKM